MKPQKMTLTEDEMQTLASDIREGKVFTSGDIRLGERHLMGQIFMDFLWMGVREAQRVNEEGVGLVYQYLDQRKQNLEIYGYPRFDQSMWLTHEQAWRVNCLALGLPHKAKA